MSEMNAEETDSDIHGTKNAKNKKVEFRFRTTSSEYGKYSPNVHTMPCYFYPINGQFTQHLGRCGMYRNHSLNTSSR
ncbi:hypothetical protein D915_008906 [Fasciola hepatica]|uniref:Uncharacterized protein n=1 Tax=Fasciola hepatica TaxID=6192 RepID=A0A2H1BW18_FASHE|nr:hypothetical protein D915_008906 [Fasciola hepatica]